MKKLQTALLIVFVFAVFGLTDPTGFLMPTSLQMTVLAIVIVLYALILGLVFKEKPQDEREMYILNQSSRHAFLIGTLTLIVGITAQTLKHQLDSWLVWSLSLMIITKLIGIIRNY